MTFTLLSFLQVGTGVGARCGVLIKGGEALETAHKVNAVLFDKTGTLTVGAPSLTDVVLLPLPPHGSPQPEPRLARLSQLQLLALVAAAEASSEHPLGRAVVEGAQKAAKDMLLGSAAAEANGRRLNSFRKNTADPAPELPPLSSKSVVNPLGPMPSPLAAAARAAAAGELPLYYVPPESFEVVPGYGLHCDVCVPAAFFDCGAGPDVTAAPVPLPPASVTSADAPTTAEDAFLRVAVGNRAWMAQIGVAVPPSAEAQLARLERRGATAVAVAGVARAVLGIADAVRPEARAAVMALRSLGCDVWMVTGDHAVTAARVAAAVGIRADRVLAEVRPEHKAAKVAALQGDGRTVAMVGDGINDSPALAAADVGMAIGAGAQIAVASAGVVLIRSDLRDVVVALHLSRVVFRRIWINFIWALGYNAIGVPFAAGAFFPLLLKALPPEFAGLAMALSSVSVVISSLLLKRYRKPDVDALAAEYETKLATEATSRRSLVDAALNASRRALGWQRKGPLTSSSAPSAARAGLPSVVPTRHNAMHKAVSADSAAGAGSSYNLLAHPDLQSAEQLVAPAAAASLGVASPGVRDALPKGGLFKRRLPRVRSAAAAAFLPVAPVVPTLGDRHAHVTFVDLSQLRPACSCGAPSCKATRLEATEDWELAWDTAERRASITPSAASALSAALDDGDTNPCSNCGEGCNCKQRARAFRNQLDRRRPLASTLQQATIDTRNLADEDGQANEATPVSLAAGGRTPSLDRHKFAAALTRPPPPR
jgi:Cu+-exporting ATPase